MATCMPCDPTMPLHGCNMEFCDVYSTTNAAIFGLLTLLVGFRFVQLWRVLRDRWMPEKLVHVFLVIGCVMRALRYSLLAAGIYGNYDQYTPVSILLHVTFYLPPNAIYTAYTLQLYHWILIYHTGRRKDRRWKRFMIALLIVINVMQYSASFLILLISYLRNNFDMFDVAYVAFMGALVLSLLLGFGIYGYRLARMLRIYALSSPSTAGKRTYQQMSFLTAVSSTVFVMVVAVSVTAVIKHDPLDMTVRYFLFNRVTFAFCEIVLVVMLAFISRPFDPTTGHQGIPRKVITSPVAVVRTVKIMQSPGGEESQRLLVGATGIQ